jgi:hypothetical protein
MDFIYLGAVALFVILIVGLAVGCAKLEDVR